MAELKRVRMTEAEVEKFIAKYQKERELSDKELNKRLRHTAATRLATLDRYQSKGSKPKAAKKASKPKASKPKAAKAE